MIAHPNEALQYSQLKLNLALQFSLDIEDYMKGKRGFIEQINARKSGELSIPDSIKDP
jgi:GrpB-like predicted nucleotidyltransferase (UPF0157 family)